MVKEVAVGRMGPGLKLQRVCPDVLGFQMKMNIERRVESKVTGWVELKYFCREIVSGH